MVVVVLVVAVFSMMAAGVGSVHEFVSNPSCKGPLRISGWPWAVMNQGSGQTTVAVWSPLGSEHAASVVACGSPTDALNWAAGGVACCSRGPYTAGASPTIPLPPVAVRGDPAPGVRKMMEVSLPLPPGRGVRATAPANYGVAVTVTGAGRSSRRRTTSRSAALTMR